MKHNAPAMDQEAKITLDTFGPHGGQPTGQPSLSWIQRQQDISKELRERTFLKSLDTYVSTPGVRHKRCSCGVSWIVLTNGVRRVRLVPCQF